MPKLTIVSEEVVIDAPIELAWEILTDTSSYGEWNPFTTSIKTDFQIGSTVQLEVHLGAITLHETEILEAFEPPHRLAWSQDKAVVGSIVGVCALREQCLTKLGDNQCSYVSRDFMSGPLTPFVKLFFGKSVRDGFTSVGKGLKEYAEARIREQGA